METLQWLRASGFEWSPLTCSYAAKGGHPGRPQVGKGQRMPLNEETCWAAAGGGTWTSSSGPGPADASGVRTRVDSAAEGGHLVVLKWLRANGCPWNEYTCTSAAKGGHLDVLKWARANGCPWDKETCAFAAEGDHLAVLKWARAQRMPLE